MDDGQPRMVGYIFLAPTGWAGATRAKTKGALRDNSTKRRKNFSGNQSLFIVFVY